MAFAFWLGAWATADAQDLFAQDRLAQDRRAAVNLVLAIDVSESVDEWEHDLQNNGLATALRHPDVIAAIESVGGIGIAIFQWGNLGQHGMLIPWRTVRNGQEAMALADTVQRSRRSFKGAGTAIADALRFATELHIASPIQSVRKVIDISGDGPDNRGGRTREARDRAVNLGITINALPILNEHAQLDLYYRDLVVGGPKHFVMPAAIYEDFADAMVKKLIREIGDPVLSRALGRPAGPDQGQSRQGQSQQGQRQQG